MVCLCVCGSKSPVVYFRFLSMKLCTGLCSVVSLFSVSKSYNCVKTNTYLMRYISDRVKLIILYNFILS